MSNILASNPNTNNIAVQVGGIQDHTKLTNIGTNTHPQIDTHIANAVVGPASATDKAIARYDGTTGKIVKDSIVGIGDTGEITGAIENTMNTLSIYKIMTHGLHTCLVSGGEVTINADTTKFDVSAGEVMVIDQTTDPENPVYTKVTWTAFTAVTPTFPANGLSYITIDVTGSIVQLAVAPTSVQLRTLASLAFITTPTGSTIFSISPIAHTASDGFLLQDFVDAVGLINISGNNFNAASTDLTIRKETGKSFARSLNLYIDPANANVKINAVTDPVGFNPIYDNGSGAAAFGAFTTSIDPTQYDDGSGTLQTLPPNKWTNKIIHHSPGPNQVVVQYGDTIYNSFDEAVAGISTMLLNPIIGEVTASLARTILTVKKENTDLSDTSQVKFTPTGKFGFAG